MGLREFINRRHENANGCGGNPCWNAAMLVTFLICLKILPSPTLQYILVFTSVFSSAVFCHSQFLLRNFVFASFDLRQKPIQTRFCVPRRLNGTYLHKVGSGPVRGQTASISVVITVAFASVLFCPRLVRRLAFHEPTVFTDTCSFRRPPAERNLSYINRFRIFGRPNDFKLHGYYR